MGKRDFGRIPLLPAKGSIELITSAATHGYLPLLGTDEAVQAQVKLGIDTYRRHFRKEPRGIWLPECAYRPAYEWKSPVGKNEVPWPRKGVEEFLKENGIEYFFTDSHMIRGGEPLGTYAANFPQLAEYSRAASASSLRLRNTAASTSTTNCPMASHAWRAIRTTVKVGRACTATPATRTISNSTSSFIPAIAILAHQRRQTRPRQKGPYDPWRAFENLSHHADDFLRTLKGTLARFRGESDKTGIVVAMYDTELFGHWWWEGPEFLYEAAKRIHNDPDIECVRAPI